MKKSFESFTLEISENGIRSLLPSGICAKENGRYVLPVCAVTKEDGPHPGMNGCEGLPFNENLPLKDTVFQNNGYSMNYTIGNLEIAAKVTYEYGVFRQISFVKNIGTEPKTLEHLSSCLLGGLDRAGKKYWFHDHKLMIHYCRSGWSREAQWCSVTPDDLGIFPGSDANEGFSASHRFSSRGSWSTGTYYPILLVEDAETNICYFVELIGPTNWTIEIGSRSDTRNGTFYVEANSADLYDGQWKKRLAPGETYQAVPAIFGVVQGGVEEAVRTLTDYKRKHTLSSWENGVPKVCFNDYMNGLHANLSDERVLSAARTASDLGVEVYVMDAGWAGVIENGIFDKRFGEWIPCDKKFNQYGLKGIIEQIHSMGLIPGIWMEVERFAKGTTLERKKMYIQNADGTPRADGDTYFADFTKPFVRNFIKNKIQMLYQMGIRYIKNDYNASTMFGPDGGYDSPGEGNVIYAQAVRAFFKEIRAEYPDLILENCGSGGMRSDQGMLSIFTLQSITDEEGYLYMPGILSGSDAVMPPEKAGVWVYVYPQNNAIKLPFGSEEYKQSMLDGEETIFNMVTGQFGVICMGGRPDCADESNLAFAQEGIEIYKKNRKYLAESYPVYPCGFLHKGKEKNTAFGLIHPGTKRMILGVWRFEEDNVNTLVHLNKYGSVRSVEQIYPHHKKEVPFKTENGKLFVSLPKCPSARLFEVMFE